MNEPRKPIFGFLWAQPDPQGPLDGDYHQIRPVRVVGRGFIRVAALVVLSALTVIFVGSALMAALVTGALGPTLAAAAIGATLTFVVLRGWIVGTFVSDGAVRVETMWRRRELPWSDITSVVTVDGRVPFLGSPVRVSGQRVVLRLSSGLDIRTHVYTASPDLWLRPEAYDIAHLRLIHWSEH